MVKIKTNKIRTLKQSGSRKINQERRGGIGLGAQVNPARKPRKPRGPKLILSVKDPKDLQSIKPTKQYKNLFLSAARRMFGKTFIDLLIPPTATTVSSGLQKVIKMNSLLESSLGQGSDDSKKINLTKIKLGSDFWHDHNSSINASNDPTCLEKHIWTATGFPRFYKNEDFLLYSFIHLCLKKNWYDAQKRIKNIQNIHINTPTADNPYFATWNINGTPAANFGGVHDNGKNLFEVAIGYYLFPSAGLIDPGIRQGQPIIGTNIDIYYPDITWSNLVINKERWGFRDGTATIQPRTYEQANLEIRGTINNDEHTVAIVSTIDTAGIKKNPSDYLTINNIAGLYRRPTPFSEYHLYVQGKELGDISLVDATTRIKEVLAQGQGLRCTKKDRNPLNNLTRVNLGITNVLLVCYDRINRLNAFEEDVNCAYNTSSSIFGHYWSFIPDSQTAIDLEYNSVLESFCDSFNSNIREPNTIRLNEAGQPNVTCVARPEPRPVAMQVRLRQRGGAAQDYQPNQPNQQNNQIKSMNVLNVDAPKIINDRYNKIIDELNNLSENNFQFLFPVSRTKTQDVINIAREASRELSEFRDKVSAFYETMNLPNDLYIFNYLLDMVNRLCPKTGSIFIIKDNTNYLHPNVIIFDIKEFDDYFMNQLRLKKCMIIKFYEEEKDILFNFLEGCDSDRFFERYTQQFNNLPDQSNIEPINIFNNDNDNDSTKREFIEGCCNELLNFKSFLLLIQYDLPDDLELLRLVILLKKYEHTKFIIDTIILRRIVYDVEKYISKFYNQNVTTLVDSLQININVPSPEILIFYAYCQHVNWNNVYNYACGPEYNPDADIMLKEEGYLTEYYSLTIKILIRKYNSLISKNYIYERPYTKKNHTIYQLPQLTQNHYELKPLNNGHQPVHYVLQPITRERPVMMERPITREPPIINERPIMMEGPITRGPPIINQRPFMMEQPVMTEPLRSRKSTRDLPILKKTRTRKYTKQTNRTITRRFYNVFSRFNENPVIRTLEPRSADNLISNPLSRTFTTKLSHSPNQSNNEIWSPIPHELNNNGRRSGEWINEPQINENIGGGRYNQTQLSPPHFLSIKGSRSGSKKTLINQSVDPLNLTTDPSFHNTSM